MESPSALSHDLVGLCIACAVPQLLTRKKRGKRPDSPSSAREQTQPVHVLDLKSSRLGRGRGEVQQVMAMGGRQLDRSATASGKNSRTMLPIRASQASALCAWSKEIAEEFS